MADTRRGHRDDSIYFDHRVGTARLDARLHKACAGSWRGVISLGFAPNGKRIRRKVRGHLDMATGGITACGCHLTCQNPARLGSSNQTRSQSMRQRNALTSATC
jgi:hypothetical protein